MRCRQCHVDGGITVGGRRMKTMEARFEISFMGAKMKVCKDHKVKFERMCNREKIDFEFHGLGGDKKE